MGRIRAKWIKNLAGDLVKQYPDRFSKDFKNNKKILEELKIVDSKLMRNRLAGYLVKTVGKRKF